MAATPPDPFVLVCPVCLTPLDLTASGVELDFGDFADPAAFCPACASVCRLADDPDPDR